MATATAFYSCGGGKGNDPGRIAEALALETHQLVTYVQPVGRLP